MNLFKQLKAGWYFLRRKYFPTKKEFVSKGEALIGSWLKYSNCKFDKQYFVYIPELNSKTNSVYIDFMVTKPNGDKVAIEYNGRQHYDYVPYFHKGGVTDLFKQQKRDKLVKEWCEKHNIQFLEIPYNYKTDDIVNVLKENFR